MPVGKDGRHYHVVYPGIYVYDDPEPTSTPVSVSVKEAEDVVRDVLLLNDKVTAITVNYKTAALTKQCIRTFRRHHPNVLHILVDNGSADDSTELIRRYTDLPGYTVVMNSRNAGHGPALHQAISLVKTPYFLTLDSDVEVHKPFLDDMISVLDADPSLYAVGWLRYVDRLSGVPHTWHVAPHNEKNAPFISYLHPYCGLYRLSMYKQLPPFFDHGAPCLNNMRAARDQNLEVRSFPLEGYVMHYEAGTRRMWDGDWHPSERRQPKPWDKDRKFPI